MKTATKAWLIAAAVLVIAGLLIIAGVLAKNNWKLSAIEGADKKTVTIDVNEAFESISIKADTEDITFVPSSDGKAKVEFVESENTVCSAEVKGDTLHIGLEDSRKWYEWLTFSSGRSSIKVCLPGQAYRTLTVREDTGDIVIPEEFSFESIDIEVSTGDVDCFAQASGLIRIKASTGDLRAQNISCGSMELVTSTGRMELRSVACSGDIYTQVSTGRITMEDVTCGKLTSRGSTGVVNMKNVIADGSFDIERSTGDIKFEGCDASELLIKTDTGDVTGTLLTSKVFITQSDTGRIEVPESVTGGKCKITTDTGDIKINIG